MTHETFMLEAIKEASKAQGFTKPNPMVGAVLVKNNQILASSYHQAFGKAHAERNLINNFQGDLKEAILYCTLEPCSHFNKKTPPCAQFIVQSGIEKVVIAMLDPNPQVNGNGVKLLEDNGIEVISGICEKEARFLNQPFIKAMTSSTPFIHVKIAQSLDGKMALENGDSQWITHPSTKAHVHNLRALYESIAVSGQTFRKDQPSLNVRIPPYQNHPDFSQPKPIVISKSPLEFSENFKSKGALCSKKNLDTREDWIIFFKDLKTNANLSSIFIEPGPTLFSTLMAHDLVDKLTIFIAPRLIGAGLGFEGFQLSKMNEAKRYENVQVTNLEHGDIKVDITLKEY